MNWLLNLWNTCRYESAKEVATNQVSRQLADLESENGHLKATLRKCQEDLETEQVRCRLLQLEVELLVGIHARDVGRWQQEHPIGSVS